MSAALATIMPGRALPLNMDVDATLSKAELKRRAETDPDAWVDASVRRLKEAQIAMDYLEDMRYRKKAQILAKLEKLWLRCGIDEEHRTLVTNNASGIGHGDFVKLDVEIARMKPELLKVMERVQAAALQLNESRVRPWLANATGGLYATLEHAIFHSISRARAPPDERSLAAAPGEDAVFPPPRPPGVPHVPVVALRVPKRRRG